MKINFAEIKFRSNLFEDEKPIKDFHKILANTLWQSRDAKAGKVALRLFESPEIEISDDEKPYIKAGIANFAQWVKTPILEALGESVE